MLSISIHVLREEDDYKVPLLARRFDCISIHVLREEDDTACSDISGVGLRFLSTSSARRTTPYSQVAQLGIINFYPRPPRGGRHRLAETLPRFFCISIHVLREEDDHRNVHRIKVQIYFYPRPPRGGRQAGGDVVVPVGQFLSTSSARRTTVRLRHRAVLCADFYPRPPRGGRHDLLTKSLQAAAISIHVLREEDDVQSAVESVEDKIFLSTSSARRTT